MNVSDLWDFAFMWQMFRNFVASGAPFIMMLVAIAAAGYLMGILVDLFLKRKKG